MYSMNSKQYAARVVVAISISLSSLNFNICNSRERSQGALFLRNESASTIGSWRIRSILISLNLDICDGLGRSGMTLLLWDQRAACSRKRE
jgi:hypothetical protein